METKNIPKFLNEFEEKKSWLWCLTCGVNCKKKPLICLRVMMVRGHSQCCTWVRWNVHLKRVWNRAVTPAESEVIARFLLSYFWEFWCNVWIPGCSQAGWISFSECVWVYSARDDCAITASRVWEPTFHAHSPLSCPFRCQSSRSLLLWCHLGVDWWVEGAYEKDTCKRNLERY